MVLHPDNPTRHIHHKANSIGSGHATTSPDYLHAVVESVADAGAVLITGPANAKTELVEYIRLHDRLTKVIAGVETVDHPTDAQSRLCKKISHGDGPDAAVEFALVSGCQMFD